MDFQEFKVAYQHKELVEYPNKVGDNPVVSVCVQTYQHAAYIKKCLDGILMQKTDFPIEILLGEDASTDGTREICMDYAQKYPEKIKLLLHYRENNIAIDGAPTGRFSIMCNLYRSKGKYIALCEGDDYWTDPLKLQKQVDFLENNPDCTLCYHSSRVVYVNKSRSEKIVGFFKVDPASNYKFTIEQVISDDIGMYTASMVFQSKILKNVPDWCLRIISFDVAIRLLCANKGKIGYITGKPMSVYHRGVEGAWSADEGKNREWHKKRLKNHCDVLDYFNSHSGYKYDTMIKLKKSKLYSTYLISIQEYCTRTEWAKLVAKDWNGLFRRKNKTIVRVFWHFVLGTKNYSKLKRMNSKKLG